MKVKVAQSCPTLCDPMDCPLNSPGQNTGVGSLSLLQVIFPTPGSNPGLLHHRWIIYQVSHKGSPTLQFSSVQSVSHVRLCDPMDCSTPCLPVHYLLLSLPKLVSIESVMPSNHLILCHPLLLLPSIFPSIRVFSNESVLCMRWPKYWSFSFNISPSIEHSGIIFRMDWLDLLAVQGTLKSLLQHHSSKASVLCLACFIV